MKETHLCLSISLASPIIVPAGMKPPILKLAMRYSRSKTRPMATVANPQASGDGKGRDGQKPKRMYFGRSSLVGCRRTTDSAGRAGLDDHQECR
jgi:hypothetical protein